MLVKHYGWLGVFWRKIDFGNCELGLVVASKEAFVESQGEQVLRLVGTAEQNPNGPEWYLFVLKSPWTLL